MELVPIIYDVLLFVSLLLFVAISVSFIASRLKKKTVPVRKVDNTKVLNEIRTDQANYNRTKPIIHRLSAHPSYQRATQKIERKKAPNIKVIRRSNVSKSDIHEKNKKTRFTYYPNAERGKLTSGSKSRYTILNGNSSGRNLSETNSTFDQPSEQEERYANFR